MLIQSELCHIEANRTIVRVSAWKGEKSLGSALGEGPTVEIAEDKGIKRLMDRIKLENLVSSDELIERNKVTIHSTNEDKNKQDRDCSNDTKQTLTNSNKDPEEWSKELSEIEIEIKRLKWDRQQENKFLKEFCGKADRNRITSYRDLLKYLERLKSIKENETNDGQLEESEKNKLISSSDYIIKKLNWSTAKAREFLNKKMKVSSRQQLKEDDLKEFISLLKLEIKDDSTR